ncbi:MAG TPA: ATP-binding protein, partial [Marinagarivorans sp.]
KPMHFAYHEPHFLALAERLATQEQRAAIYDLRGFPVAQSGRLSLGQGLPDFDARNSWLMRLYYLLASRPSLPYQSPAIPLGETHSQWFFNRVSPVARAVVPIRDPKSSAPLGHLVLDKQDVGFDVLLAGIYGQFVFICVVFAIFTVLMLLGFASLHSWRIRKLAQHAEKAIDPTGNLRANFIASRVPDEIGQLSRSFEILLKRLVGHQDYLKNLASKLSHELRTPLAIAQSSLDNLKASRLDDQQLTYLARAHDGVARLSQTLNAMSSVNALEQALKQTDKERFCLYAMLQSLTDAYTATYPQSVVMQWYSRPPVLPVTVEAAPELLVQMLDKLVENASQFSQAQHPITIATSVSEKEPKHITLVVSNRGAPLPASIEDQLFESMVSSRVGRPYDGEVHLGLGLYIARLICEHHGGSIRARSEPAEPGSSVAIVSFEMKLPIVIAPPLGPEAGNGKKSKMV